MFGFVEKRQDKKTAEYLRAAARLIDVCGWTRYESRSPKGEYCANGAILCVTDFDQKWSSRCSEAVSRYLYPKVGCFMGITTWNDYKAKGKYEVVKTLLDTADAVEAG